MNVSTMPAPDPADDAQSSSFRPMSHRADIAEAVRATALLADVTLSMWGAERTDPAIMAKAKQDAGAVGNVGRAVKNVLAGADTEYRALRAAFNGVRAQHHALTLPWVSDPQAERQRGPRLLPTALWDRYIEAMQDRKRAATQALDAFVVIYPDRVIQAQANLAKLANADDYPDQQELRSLFRVSFDFEPIPAGTAFRGLPDVTLGKLDAQLRRRQGVMLETATRAMWTEVRDRMTRVHELATKGGKSVRQPSITAACELPELLPGWNIGRDPRALEVAHDIEQAFLPVAGDAAKLRESEAAQGALAERAQAVLDKLAQWGL